MSIRLIYRITFIIIMFKETIAQLQPKPYLPIYDVTFSNAIFVTFGGRT